MGAAMAQGPTNYVGDFVPAYYWPGYGAPYAPPFAPQKVTSCPHINCPICNAARYTCSTCGGTYTSGHYCPGPNKTAKGWTLSNPKLKGNTIQCSDIQLKE